MTNLPFDLAQLKAYVVDESSNDLLGRLIFMKPKRKVPIKDWLMIFHRGSEILAKDRDMTGQVLRIYLFAISRMDFENRLAISQAGIAEELGLKQQRVSEAFRLLVKKGVFVEGTKYGTVKTYYLNSEFGWKGTASNLLKHVAEEAKEELESLKSKV